MCPTPKRVFSKTVRTLSAQIDQNAGNGEAHHSERKYDKVNADQGEILFVLIFASNSCDKALVEGVDIRGKMPVTIFT